MMPTNDSVQFQKLFADSIRRIKTPVPEQLDPRGLSIYRRLIHNNIRQFLELCFSDSKLLVDATYWQQLQQRFVAEATLQSPFFNDIPQQFLEYVNKIPEEDRPANAILEMMDFEVELLKVEITITPEVNEVWGTDTLLVWSPAACLKECQFDFISSNLTEYKEGKTYVIIWRNREDDVCYQSLELAEWLLLRYFSEQSSSISQVKQQLYALTDGALNQDWISKTIEKWIIKNVLMPMEQ